MAEYYYKMNLAGTELAIKFRYPQTASYFRDYLRPCKVKEDAVCVPEDEILEHEVKWETSNKAYIEYSLSAFYCCDTLFRDQRCVFHGVAFLWRGKAFLITAASGVGKTTQLRNWQAICGGEIAVINGDKPVLRNDGGVITVHPSPWKGKERYGDDTKTAQLAGIIYLEQAEEDQIRRMEPREAVQPMLKRMLSTFDTEETVLNACRFCDALLKEVPVWYLLNRGGQESTYLARDVLMKEVIDHEV